MTEDTSLESAKPAPGRVFTPIVLPLVQQECAEAGIDLSKILDGDLLGAEDFIDADPP